jgi:Fe(3+) dicitrate transport protein
MPEEKNCVKIYDSKIGLIKEAKIGSIVEIYIYQYPAKLYFYLEGFPVTEFILKDKQSDQPIYIVINKSNELNEVVLNSERKKVFNLTRLSDFEGTSIYAGKKNRSNSSWTINCKYSLK